MKQYRQLTSEEVLILKENSCWAEDWSRVVVADGFLPNFFHRVMFYGDIQLGTFDKQVEVSSGFTKHAGINDATLRNVTVGDNCLIEKVGNFINNYTIGADCYISNICTMETTEGATYGEGHLVSVLNEMGDGNVILFTELNSQLAAFMVKHFNDRQLKETIHRMVKEDVKLTNPERGTIGNGVKIINTKEITNTVVCDDCEISGASRLSDCTIMSSKDDSVYIGTGVICENSIISNGCSITNSVKMQDCFVGEACQITNGFTAEASIFFANSFMANGEACAAFCGPFSASHHKSSLLIGGEFSFYNAGSNTNFSNHAYKMGPLHYGTLERGTKTASGSYVLMPATIGAFSVCFGKLMHHPDTRCLPFSYLMAYGDTMYLVPGRNITTVGHQEMAQARQACSLVAKEYHQFRLALAVHRGRDCRGKENPGGPSAGFGRQCVELQLPRIRHQRVVAAKGYQVLRHSIAHLYGCCFEASCERRLAGRTAV